ncbi:paraquat-inducible protein A [Rhodobium orientis]|uniref:Paraquat-inducible membrane protein A n=1 Tax=Rhodobium orientis TaxID=34017 RepID=A0A327JGT5_9HYPH|nr:paraquat-inducible protein A [Rhodobium orientis]MBB4303065.1 paraquat-inducible protein A [Rhodobium orientis]MBK5948304.1 paraquat-inducible membrane protein A [Rhodobium orientis]RAI25141.1 paraquat-inducible membrane protein A [Rhodobium orientis]
MRLILAVLLYVAGFSFGLGLTLPLVRFETLYFFEETPTLIEIVETLYREGDTFLAVIIGAFSIAFPALKLLLLFLVAVGGSSAKRLGALSAVSKWSMMDVMVVALAIVAAKTSGLAAAVTLPGIWFYSAATISSAVAAMILHGRRR